MKSTDSLPWYDIQTPQKGYNIQRIDPNHPHGYFWAKDSEGSYLLFLELTKELTDFLDNKLVDLQGVKADITWHPSTSQYFFSLKLQNKEDADIFYRLCFDLIDRTADVHVLKVALEIINNRLKRWKAFLRGKKKNILTPQEVRGLFAELILLQKGLLGTQEQLAVIEGWQGPLGEPQDFVFGDFAVEVKSITGTQKNRVKISSEHQLFTHLDKLYLHVTYLSEFHDCKNGLSLNQQVEAVRDAISDPDHLDVLEARLLKTGYLELKDYDSPSFTVSRCKSFLVTEAFPRIVPGDLKDGVSCVTYDLDLKSIESYLCEPPM